MPIAGHVMMGRLAYDSKNSSDRRIAREALWAGFRKFWFQPGAGNEAIRKLLEKRPGVSLVMDRCVMIEAAGGPERFDV